MQKLLIFIAGLSFTVASGFFVISFLQSRPKSHQTVSNAVTVVQAESSESATPAPIIAPLTLDSIFSQERIDPNSDDLLLYATGDIIPARVTDTRIRSKGVDYPFEKVTDVLQSADVVVANLEAPLIQGCPVHVEGMVFCGQPSFASAMTKANISIATLENNHISNYGSAGKAETVEHLTAAGVMSVVSGKPVITTIKDMRLGVVAVNGVGPKVNLDLVTDEIQKIRDQVDIVAVSIHWGKEYTYLPAKAAGIAPDFPQEIGHALIDAGADLIIGNHPHWVQGVELYKNGFITYAHGNFIFDQEWSRETTEGVIGSYLFRNKKLIDVHFIPVVLEDYAQPRVATESEANKILQAMYTSSLQLR